MPINIAMFKNSSKEKESQPDYTGWNKETGDNVSGWVKTSVKGDKYISLKFETGAEKKERLAKIKDSVEPNHSYEAQKPDQSFDEFDDDIPF